MSERTKGEWFYQYEDGNFAIYDSADSSLTKYGCETAIIPHDIRSFEEREANAKFICRAVNNHDRLVSALENLVELANNAVDKDELQHLWKPTLDAAEKILAEAK